MPAEHCTLISHVRLIDCQKRTAEDCDLLFRHQSGGRPSELLDIGKNLVPANYSGLLTKIRAAGLYACRAFVDLHMHTCEPGAMYKEDIRTATLAAVKGGYGTLLALPDESGANWQAEETLDYIYSNAAARSSCELKAAAFLTVRNQGKKLCDFDRLNAHKAAAFYDDGHTPPALLYHAMKACAERNALLILRPEDHILSAGGAVNQPIARVLHCHPIAPAAETVPLAAALTLAAETNCRLHITLVSTALSVQLIREAKARGVKVTCDTAPQYFTLTQSDLPFYGSLAKVNPPLRSAEDREAVLTALADGTIDCIVSDHTPESTDEKHQSIADAAFGMIGLQSTFALGMRELVLTNRINIYRLIELLAEAPAAILGLPAGLKPGCRADLNLLDLNSEYTLVPGMLHSKSQNCPWIGQTFSGSVKRNFFNGK